MFLVRLSSVNGFDAVSASGGGSEHPVEQLDRISVRIFSPSVIVHACKNFFYFVFLSLSLKLFASSACAFH